MVCYAVNQKAVTGAAKAKVQKERADIANIFYYRVSGFDAGACFTTKNTLNQVL